MENDGSEAKKLRPVGLGVKKKGAGRASGPDRRAA
jgi:hypothetical protein